MIENKISKSSRKTFWAVAAFYGLIAFEFFYMASPFAAYFYSIYRPGLTLIANVPGMEWLLSFFLPHIVNDTSLIFINMHNLAGAFFVTIGFLIFSLSAGQVYYAKLRNRGVVTGGLYKTVRHPQYTAFTICSFGLLLLWPRYLVLIMFITLLFAYYFLAKLEERECVAKFGEKYLAYKESTDMFLPFRLKFITRPKSIFISKKHSAIFYLSAYLLILMVSLNCAFVMQKCSIESLYAFSTRNNLYLAVNKIETTELQVMAKIAATDERVATLMDSLEEKSNVKFLNYVLPAQWFISEIPMNNNRGSNHFLGLQKDENNFLYKIIFTRAIIPDGKIVTGKEILLATRYTVPVLEVWINTLNKKVIEVLAPPRDRNYENIPVPVY